MSICTNTALHSRNSIKELLFKPHLCLGDVLPLLEQGPLEKSSVEDLSCLLHKFRKVKDRGHVLRLLAYIQRIGQEDCTSLGNYLIPMLIGVDCISDAQHVFDVLVYRNEWSCYSLISGYIKCQKPRLALYVYQRMKEGHSALPSEHIFVALLKACAMLKDVEKGIQLHCDVVKMGLLEGNLFVGSSLVDMYAKCESLVVAHQVFNKLHCCDVVSWNVLIAGYTENGDAEEALQCFVQMQSKRVSPSDVTYICILKACGRIGAIAKGQEIHADIEKRGWLKRYILIGNALVDMYAKCGFPTTSEHVFDRLPTRDIVSWNALIAGYVDCGSSEKALKCYEQMQLTGVAPDAVTLVCSLKACGKIGSMRKGEEIHSEIERSRLLDRDPFIGCTLVDMYAKGGLLVKAQKVFEKLPVRTVVSWTTLIAGYTEARQGEEALKCFDYMQFEGVSPNAITYVWSLKACATIGAIDKGGEIHAEIETRGFLGKDLIGNTLVDMYAKCGLLLKAEQAFDKLKGRDVVSWTTLMAGFAQLGKCEKALHIFSRMQRESIKPNLVTFFVLLSMCNRVGLLHKCQTYLDAMGKTYGFIPAHQHVSCVFDFLYFTSEVENSVAVMPPNSDLLGWQTLLHACRNSGNLDLGKWAFKRAIKLNKRDALSYVLMSHIIAAQLQEGNS